MSDALLDALPVHQRLALSYAPRRVRDETLAMFALENRLSTILRQKGETIIAQMKLAWWRDRFAQGPGEWPKGEPLLSLLQGWPADHALLGALVDGWELMLGENLGELEIAEFASRRAVAWAGLSEQGDAARAGGRQYALADLALHLDDGEERRRVLGALHRKPFRADKPMRPLEVLRSLYLRALDRGTDNPLDGPGAMALAMRVGIAGR